MIEYSLSKVRLGSIKEAKLSFPRATLIWLGRAHPKGEQSQPGAPHLCFSWTHSTCQTQSLFYPKERPPICPLLQMVPGAGEMISIKKVNVYYPNWGLRRALMQNRQSPRAIGTNKDCLRTTETCGHSCSLPHQCLQSCHTLQMLY